MSVTFKASYYGSYAEFMFSYDSRDLYKKFSQNRTFNDDDLTK